MTGKNFLQVPDGGQCAADNAGRAWAVANRHRDHWLGRHMAGSEWRAQPRRARGPSALTWFQRNLRAPLETTCAPSGGLGVQKT